MVNNLEQFRSDTRSDTSEHCSFKTGEEFVANCPPGTFVNFRGNMVPTLDGEVYNDPNSKYVWLRVGTTKTLVPWAAVSVAPHQSESFLKFN